MSLFNDLFTNIFWDGEASDTDPDASGDYYFDTDGQVDHLYWEARLVDMLISLSQDPTKEFFILFGGEVTDGGSGTVNIAECVAIGRDSNSKKHIIHIPALTGIAVPSGYKDNRQVWVKAVYDFKLGTATRTHWTGVSYHYQLLDTYMGDSNGYVSTGTADLFTDSNPNSPSETCVVIGSFQMSAGNVFTDNSYTTSSGRTRKLSMLPRVKTITAATSMYPNYRYLVNGSSRVTLTLPLVSSVGDTIELIDISGFGFQVAQNASQNIYFLNVSSIPGVTGYYKSRTAYSSVRLVCTVANTTWQAVEIRDELVMKGYCMGGTTGGGSYVNVIDDMNFSSESSNVITATLDTNKDSGCGVFGQLKGYCMGGGSASGYVNVIEDMNFSNETSNVITATLNTAKGYGCGVSGSLKGYCMGGSTGSYVNVIEDMNFIDETSNVITATLNDNKLQGCGTQKVSLKGYYMGGYTTTNVNVIEDMNFSNETSNVITATLDTAKSAGCGVSGPSKGYCMGGTTGSPSNVIEDMNFSNETSAAISATLNTAKASGCGVSGSSKGYCMGGNTGSYIDVIEDMTFSNETSNVITATLNTARSNGCGTQGYIG